MSEWISVKDKLPEKSDHNDYLITDGEHFYVGHYRYKAKAWAGFKVCTQIRVKHMILI